MTRFRFIHTTCWALLIALSTTVAVHAHGTLEYPGSRSWLCLLEGPESPESAACQEAVRVGGPQPLYEWDSIRRLDAGGNHQEVVKDGELCNASMSYYDGFNLPLQDWVKTPIFPDENGRLSMLFNAPAPHVTDYWRFYLTKDGWDPLERLKWSDLEDEPFCELGNVPVSSPKQSSRYEFDCPMPTDKEGYHILYLIQQRSDSPGAYYSCSDVIVMDTEPTPTPTSAATGECVLPLYSDIVVYEEGDTVIFDGQAWEAQWWVRGGDPGWDEAWALVEACTGIMTPFPTTLPRTDTPTNIPTRTPTVLPSREPTITRTPLPSDTPDLTPTLTPTSASIYPAGAPLNVGHAAGSDTAPNSVIGLFVVTVSLSLSGAFLLLRRTP